MGYCPFTEIPQRQIKPSQWRLYTTTQQDLSSLTNLLPSVASVINGVHCWGSNALTHFYSLVPVSASPAVDGGTPGSTVLCDLSSLDTFTQHFLQRAWPRTRVLERGSRSVLVVTAYAFSCPPARLCISRSLNMSPSRSNQWILLCTTRSGILVPPMARNHAVIVTDCAASFRRLFVPHY